MKVDTYAGAQVPTFVQKPDTPHRYHVHTATVSHHTTFLFRQYFPNTVL